MDKLLRGLIVVLLLLSIGALALEFMLFSKREEFKGRSLKLADGIVALAPYIETPASNADIRAKDNPHLMLKRDQLWNYYQVDAQGKKTTATMGPGTIADELQKIKGLAASQVDRMNDLRDTLVRKETKLAETEATLDKTTKDLEAANADIKQKTDTIATQQKDIDDKGKQIVDLKAKGEELSAKVDEQKKAIGDLGDKIKDKDSQIGSMTNYITQLEGKIRKLEGVTVGSTNAINLARGLQGKVVIVEPKWGFVVLDLIPDSQLVPGIELLVQRKDQLVGKIRIQAVFSDRRLAIGEVRPGWEQKNLTVAAGDVAFF